MPTATYPPLAASNDLARASRRLGRFLLEQPTTGERRAELERILERLDDLGHDLEQHVDRWEAGHDRADTRTRGPLSRPSAA